MLNTSINTKMCECKLWIVLLLISSCAAMKENLTIGKYLALLYFIRIKGLIFLCFKVNLTISTSITNI